MENLIIQVGKSRGHIGSPRHLLQSSNQSNDDPPPNSQITMVSKQYLGLIGHIYARTWFSRWEQ